jgi:hypothetical protein
MIGDEEFRFKIEAYSPETMPMARLAEYLIQLATILGEEKAVHFVKLEPGSTQVVHRVEREAVPKVRARAASVRRGDGPSEAKRAYRRVNRLLREDNGSAVLEERSTGAQIISFPGVKQRQESFVGVSQRTSIDGKVVRVGGVQKWVPITLQSEGETIPNCYCTPALAKDLGRKLWEYVRLHGLGKWTRDGEGRWTLDSLHVDSFEPLIDETLPQALDRLSAAAPKWDRGSLSEVEALRREV